MTVIVLHLSDIHIRSNRDPVLTKANAIAAAVYADVASARLVVIAITGDIAFSGLAEEYAAASTFVSEIRDALSKETRADVRVVVAPGNHDCDFKKCNVSRENNIAALASANDPVVDPSVIDSCTEVQAAFFEFRNSIENWEQFSDDKLWRSLALDVGGKLLRIEVLNVAWVSKLKEQRNLYFPIEHYERHLSEPADCRIVMLHHPFNWYSVAKYRQMRSKLRRGASLIMSGHEHEGNVGIVDETDSDKSAFVEGWVLQHDNKDLTDTGFNVLQLDLDSRKFNSVSYKYAKGKYIPATDGSWEDFHDLPDAGKPQLAMRREFHSQLTDPGAYFAGQRADLTLSDLYVYPDLREVGAPRAMRKFISAKTLREPTSTAGGVIVQGDDRSGCTSLLKELFVSYLDLGFCPILISGASIKKTDPREIDALIDRALKTHFEEESIVCARQFPRAKKILLLDDFDEVDIQDVVARAKLLSSFRERFDHIVVTVGKLFEVKETLDRDAAKELASMKHYEIQQFGFKKRAELIERWMTVKGDISRGETEAIAKLDKVERIFNVAMDKALIPSAPLYLLTLLQSVDAGRSDDLRESGLGHYYHYLLSSAFSSVGVPNSKWQAHFDYCAQLAWEFHKKGRSELSELELRSFNDEFSAEYFPVDFGAQLKVLLGARVLHLNGAAYEFRYPYMYYYLKGMFLSKNLGLADVRNYVERCCRHLYVRDHANTVLFLAHHASDEWLIDTLTAQLSGIFDKTPELTFDGDTQSVLQLISDAPQLTYRDDHDPREERARRHVVRDEAEEAGDGLRDAEESAGDLSLASQLAMLFKTIEILGQILKNQYSSIRRQKRQELLTALFKGPLRALGMFYRFHEQNPAQFIEQIEDLMKRRGGGQGGQVAARRIVANLFLGVTVGILLRASRSTNADELLSDVNAIVKQESTTGFALMELSMLLDSAKDIPRVEITEVLKRGRNDLLVELVTSILVMNRLYMFKTSRTDKFWVSKELKIGLEQQQQIEYQNSGRQIA